MERDQTNSLLLLMCRELMEDPPPTAPPQLGTCTNVTGV